MKTVASQVLHQVTSLGFKRDLVEASNGMGTFRDIVDPSRVACWNIGKR